MTVPAEHRAFAGEVAVAKAQDPMPTFAVLAETTGLPVEDIVHYWLAPRS